MPSPDEHDDVSQTARTLVVTDEGEDSPPGNLQVVVIGNGTFATHPLADGAALTIGRSTGCDITVDEESISRKHAILTVGETTTIEDLGSANGTLVRGKRLKPKHPAVISVGELVGLGTASIIVQQRSRTNRAPRLWTHDKFEPRLDEECRSETEFALLCIHPQRRAPAHFVEETLAELLRESDILGKYGPHEYEVLLPKTSAANAEEAVRRIESKLLERGVKSRIFVACWPRDGRSTRDLIAKVRAAIQERAATAGADIVVSDPAMQSLHRLVAQVAGSQIGVLLLGETGVGKEVFARALHRASPRAAGPFVEINCAALTESLLESELFGHEKGAFTNAVSAKAGLLETADGGTMLLDEIGDMPLATQAKLLRVIEDSQLRRVGGLKARSIDVRFIAATNSDLELQIANGGFRRDLFFRLNGVTIVIPPLRERTADLEPLSQAFIKRAWSPDDGPLPTLAPEALELMKSYSWPGNVRELKNMIARAVLLCGPGPITPEHLPVDKLRDQDAGPRTRGDTRPLPPIDAAMLAKPHRKGSPEEQHWILQMLDRTGGNQTLAARMLGISRRTLVNRLNEYKQGYRPRKDKKQRAD